MMLAAQPGSLTEVATGRCWSPAEIQHQIDLRVTRFHALGLTRGDRVLLHFGNRLEVFAEILAIWQAGGCAIPVDARLTPFEIRNLAQVAQARFSVVDDAAAATTPADVADAHVVHTSDLAYTPGASPRRGSLWLDDDALVLFTSGTTGEPKGVVHTHRSLRARWVTLRQALGLEAYRRTLCVLPTHFGHGLICNCLFPWLYGCDLFIAPPFKPELLMQLGAVLDEHRITFVSSVPSMWNLALRVAKGPTRKTLERIHIGSAPLSVEMWSKVQAWSGIKQVLNAYGITETGSWVAGTTGGEVVPEDGLIGHLWGATAAVMQARSIEELADSPEPCTAEELGMIWLNTPALMRGYFKREELTEAVVHQGWFVTGDLGLLDSRGRLHIRGRERDEINKAGTKIFPAAIDLVVQEADPVLDVCAFGVEDPLYGENVAVALTLNDDSAETIVALHSWIRERLAEHKQPERWYLLPEIPRTSRGKVNRDSVRTACGEREPLDLKGILRNHGKRGAGQ